MAKMFYTSEEAADKLSVSEEQLKGLVREGKLREFRDAGKINYKVDEVNALASSIASSSSGTAAAAGKTDHSGMSASGEITLEPIDDEGGSDINLAGSGTEFGTDMLSLEESDFDATAAGGKAEEEKKDDTVVTSIGVSVFDDDDLGDVDPLAQTVVSEGAEGLGIEGIGSGSGLLDLTRESDDTSLGADLLDEIYPSDESGVEMGDATRAGIEDAVADDDDDDTTAEDADEIFDAGPVAVPALSGAISRTAVDYAPDATSTGLTGMIVVATAVMCIAGVASASIMQGVWPSLMDVLYRNLWIFGAASAGVAGAAMGIGFVLGRRAQE